MNVKHIFVLVLLISISCGKKETRDESTAATETSSATAEASNTTEEVSTDDPAIAVIENTTVRFKLHALTEITPDPSAPGKVEAGKKVYAADISVEYLTADQTSPAEYLLTSYILDDKGNKLSLPMGSIRLASIVSNDQAQRDNISGEAFNKSNSNAGSKYRGTQYGIEIEASNKPVKWGFVLNGNVVEQAIQ